jgi:ABC-2 type transport system permease protein
VQFMPAIVIPQILLGGLLTPRERMAEPLQWLSEVLPLTYAYEALAQATQDGSLDADLAVNVAVVVACVFAALALGAATLRRRTP